MIRRIALAAFLVLLPLRAHATLDGAVIAELTPMLRDLLSLSGHGVHSFERGAFLVRESDGSVRCELWPFTNQFQRISTRLVIPSGTIAIAHTHPRTQQKPSRHDHEESARLGIPMIVVSRDTLHLIDSSGETALRWHELPAGKSSCKASSPAPVKNSAGETPARRTRTSAVRQARTPALQGTTAQETTAQETPCSAEDSSHGTP
ncbi:MAG TPA: hypothetical protein VF701_21545 [Thermoanaerobaculia bacterium]